MLLLLGAFGYRSATECKSNCHSYNDSFWRKTVIINSIYYRFYSVETPLALAKFDTSHKKTFGRLKARLVRLYMR